MRVVVENAIGAMKKWSILHKYRHYTLGNDADRARLGRVVRVIAALVNFRSQDKDAQGKPRRRLGWKPGTNKEFLRKLLTEAERIGGKEKKDFNDLLEGRKAPAELGLCGARLTEQEELLLAKKGDTTETWEVIEEAKGVVLLVSDEGDMKVVRADSRVAGSAPLATAASATPAAPAPRSRKSTYRDFDAPAQ